MKKLFSFIVMLMIVSTSFVNAYHMDFDMTPCKDEYESQYSQYSLVLECTYQTQEWSFQFFITDGLVDNKMVPGRVYTREDMWIAEPQGYGACGYNGSQFYYDSVSLVRDYLGGCVAYVTTTDGNSFSITYDARIDTVYATFDITDADAQMERAIDIESGYGIEGVAFSGTSTDGKHSVYLIVNTNSFHEGTFDESCISLKSYVIKNEEDSAIVMYANGKGNLVITSTNRNSTTYYNITFPFVGKDSILYNIDLTYHSANYTESKTSDAILDKQYENYGMYVLTFSDSLYDYEIQIDTTSFKNGNQHIICDSVTFIVYDAAQHSYLYTATSGSFTKTKVNDTTYTIVGEFLCFDGMKFYINCEQPAAVENAVMVAPYNVWNENSTIVLNGAEGEMVAIYDANGRLVSNKLATSDNERYTLNSGVYFIKVGKSVMKAIVR